MLSRLIYLFLTLSVVFAFAVSYAFSHLIPINYWELFTNEFIHALVFSALSILVWQIIKFGNYSALSSYQRIINYVAIVILMLGIWLAVSYGLFYLIYGGRESVLLQNTLFIKGFMGILLYISLIQYFYDKNGKLKLENEIEELAEEITANVNQTETLERIAVKNGQKIHVVLIPEIIYIQAEGDYVKIHTEKGKFLKEETMKYFQENLPMKQFVRVHRSYIVNVEMIQRIDVYEKQNQLVTLKNGERIKASVAGYKQLKSALNL